MYDGDWDTKVNNNPNNSNNNNNNNNNKPKITITTTTQNNSNNKRTTTNQQQQQFIWESGGIDDTSLQHQPSKSWVVWNIGENTVVGFVVVVVVDFGFVVCNGEILLL